MQVYANTCEEQPVRLDSPLASLLYTDDSPSPESIEFFQQQQMSFFLFSPNSAISFRIIQICRKGHTGSICPVAGGRHVSLSPSFPHLSWLLPPAHEPWTMTLSHPTRNSNKDPHEQFAATPEKHPRPQNYHLLNQTGILCLSFYMCQMRKSNMFKPK